LSGTWTDWLVALLLVIGGLFSLVGAVAINRFPDVYNRLHGSGVSATVGLPAILVAGTIYFSVHHGLTLKLLIFLPFLLWTGAAGTFMIGRAAHRTGPHLTKTTVRDDMNEKAGTVRPKE
jgi:multicomponent Na+:H+ antiporter subunit G